MLVPGHLHCKSVGYLESGSLTCLKKRAEGDLLCSPAENAVHSALSRIRVGLAEWNAERFGSNWKEERGK